MRERRGRRTQQHAASEVGIAQGTYSRLERGIHRPAGTMAGVVAVWLGWSEEEVAAAAKEFPQ